jgi:hypothetical protein
MWSKLAFLAPFALTTTAARTSIGDVLGDPAWKTQLDGCCTEACSVGVASGAHLDSVRIIESFASLPKGLRSSMQKDVAAGNTPELDAIAGPIVSRGGQLGIDVSFTSALADAVRARATAERPATILCGTHGKRAAAVTCGHLLDDTDRVLGFMENSSDPTGLQAWCDGCEHVYQQEGELTPAFKQFHDLKVVCDLCYARLRERHSKPLE